MRRKELQHTSAYLSDSLTAIMRQHLEERMHIFCTPKNPVLFQRT